MKEGSELESKAVLELLPIVCPAAHLILESKHFMRFDTTCEAILGLMATYYVFHIEYSSKVLNALLFIQTMVLGIEDECTQGCSSVVAFAEAYYNHGHSAGYLSCTD
ncbi:hypothetical protein OUZ56_024141 [Daphnia magna]|uniref:Uncharacterized protein n=1 Tax=Daphnia magna TaxID=35525 RepID=A0ABR0B096_9CRUS|nr:hypothetical protein OUZ56_024141 [Daphnia magna]